MITRILKSFRTGRAIYHNQGSCKRLIHYFEHEARSEGKKALYFDQTRDALQAPAVIERIDEQGQGLRKVDAKFYSLVISPSQDELRHLSNDPERLKTFARQVMENYGQNFALPGGEKLKGKELVWFATFHHTRQYAKNDPLVEQGVVSREAFKEGDHTHIHVIVSRLDKTKSFSLSPLYQKERFPIEAWQRKNAEDFRLLFGYEKQTFYSQVPRKEKALQERLERFIQQQAIDPTYLDPQRIVAIGKEQAFSWKFYRNLRHLERHLQRGIFPGNPYQQFEPQAEKVRGNQLQLAKEAGSQKDLPNGFKQTTEKSISRGVPHGKQEVSIAKVPSDIHSSWQSLQAATRLFQGIAKQHSFPDEEGWHLAIKRQRAKTKHRLQSHDSELSR